MRKREPAPTLGVPFTWHYPDGGSTTYRLVGYDTFPDGQPCWRVQTVRSTHYMVRHNQPPQLVVYSFFDMINHETPDHPEVSTCRFPTNSP